MAERRLVVRTGMGRPTWAGPTVCAAPERL